MILENSISVGNIATIIGMVGVSIGFIYVMKNQISLIQRDLLHLEDGQSKLTEAFSQLGKILTQIAVQDNRINMIEKHFDELRRGKGIIN